MKFVMRKESIHIPMSLSQLWGSLEGRKELRSNLEGAAYWQRIVKRTIFLTQEAHKDADSTLL